MIAMDRRKLCAMFFLEYFIKGAWFPLLGLYMGRDYLGFTGFQQAWVFNAFAIASIVGMFFGGQFADRYVAQERYLAVSHLIGGLAIMGLAWVKSFWPFFGLMLIHCLLYVPTLSVANAIAFAHLGEDRKRFGLLRLWGSVGWVAAAWPLIFVPIDWARVPALSDSSGVFSWLGGALSTLKSGPALEGSITATYLIAGAASLGLAAFSLTLPKTPPSSRRGERFAPFEAIKLLAVPSLFVLFVVTFFDSVVHNGYYFWTSRFFKSIGVPQNWIAPAMSIGQTMEAIAMIFLAPIIARIGWRKTLMFGVLSQSVRFGVYALGSPDLIWPVILVNVMHGFAYACFFGTVFIYVDAHFPKDVRASAQGLFNLVILGVSQFAGNFLWGRMLDVFATSATVDGKLVEGIDYHRVFLVPFGIALFSAVLLALFFHPPDSGTETAEEPSRQPKEEPHAAA